MALTCSCCAQVWDRGPGKMQGLVQGLASGEGRCCWLEEHGRRPYFTDQLAVGRTEHTLSGELKIQIPKPRSRLTRGDSLHWGLRTCILLRLTTRPSPAQATSQAPAFGSYLGATTEARASFAGWFPVRNQNRQALASS